MEGMMGLFIQAARLQAVSTRSCSSPPFCGQKRTVV